MYHQKAKHDPDHAVDKLVTKDQVRKSQCKIKRNLNKTVDDQGDTDHNAGK